ncbi:MAG: hypothetical protein OXC26_19560 [Albidovulum sp.]|nr:hypothetical protein [Albidovulum sp.]
MSLHVAEASGQIREGGRAAFALDGWMAPGRVVEMDVPVGCARPPVPEQASLDMQEFAVNTRVPRMRMRRIIKPCIRHDLG